MGSTTSACGKDDSKQQRPQQLSSPNTNFANALAFPYKSIWSIAALSFLSLIWIILLFLFF
jgi:hypothetical protein